MKPEDVNKLKPGVYRIDWGDGGKKSVASVGVHSDGTRWLAPANWIHVPTTKHWENVASAEPITTETQMDEQCRAVWDACKKRTFIVLQLGYWGKSMKSVNDAAAKCLKESHRPNERAIAKLVIGDADASVTDRGYIMGAAGAEIIDLCEVSRISTLVKK